MISNSFDASNYEQLKINFWFQSISYETGENFFVEYYDGSQWQVVADYVQGTYFANNTFYPIEVVIDRNNYAFPSNATFRIRSDASTNYDMIYVDEVSVLGL